MATIVFDPDQIGSNSSNIITNDTDITSNYTVASDNTSDITLNDGDITSNFTVASGAASDASDAVDDASDASVAASSAVSDVDVIEADDRYAQSVYSDPATNSFAVKQIDIASNSDVSISHSDTAAA